MKRLKAYAVSALICLLGTGCSMMAPKYSASLDNVQTLKNAGGSELKVGQFSSSENVKKNNPISIRGSALNSPYNMSYSEFLAEALKQELNFAKRDSNNSKLEISGELLKNDIDASGFSVGYTTIEARFVVKNDGNINYDGIKSVRHEFPSSFAGAIAIPKAVQEYNMAVQKLLGLLYEDKSFIQATK